MRNIPTEAAARLAMAETYRSAGKVQAADAILTGLIEDHPDFDPAYHALGLLACEAGKLPLAAELLVKAIVLNASSGIYHRNLGEICRRLGRLEEAILAGRRATELMPQDVDAHFNLGLAFSDHAAWNDAIASYRKALALHPEHGQSWNNLGVALDHNGERTEAERAYTRAVELNPGHAEAQLNLGTLYKQQGRLDDARRCFVVVRNTAPDLAARTGIAFECTVGPITPPDVCVRDTGTVKGRGVFAGRNFAAGEVIETSAVVLLHTPFAGLPPEIRMIAFNWADLCGVGNAHALVLGYGSLFNHDNPANMRYEADPANLAMKFIAARGIVSGEELTINYNAAGGRANWNDDNWFERMKIAPITTSSA